MSHLCSAGIGSSTMVVGYGHHKKQITYCILDRDGATICEGEIVLARNLLADFARRLLRPTDRVALEPTTNCWAVVEHLQPFVHDVVGSTHSQPPLLRNLPRCESPSAVRNAEEAAREV